MFKDIYHPAVGAWPQAEHIFLKGNGLPQRWANQSRFVILETGFGLGNNFLATWAAWKKDPQRCERLIFLSVEKHPLTTHDLQQAHVLSPDPTLSQQLIDAWPSLTPGMHLLDFEERRVQLHLMLGDIEHCLKQLMANVDAFFLDGFSPERNPAMWSPFVFKHCQRLAASGATAATWSAAKIVRDGLTRANFDVRRTPGWGDKRDMTQAIFTPCYTPAPLPAGLRTPLHRDPVLIIGAGLAGCAAAWALKRQGWDARVIDRGPTWANGASGQAAGLFHGTFQQNDGPHARWHRAAALRMTQFARPRIAAQKLRGQANGLLRLTPGLSDESAQSRLAHSRLPADYLQWWPSAKVRSMVNIDPPGGAWFFAAGGWLSPAEVCRVWLEESQASFTPDTDIVSIHRDEKCARWIVHARDGREFVAATVVVANAFAAQELLQDFTPPGASWLNTSRGQTTVLSATDVEGRCLRLPVAGAGYALSLPDGALLCGATTHLDDPDPSVRAADHEANLRQWMYLSGQPAPSVFDPSYLQGLSGRTAWRALTRDRLPALGPLPLFLKNHPIQRNGIPLRQRPRLIDDNGGLYTITGLASRGLTSALLSAEVLASWITGAPCPVESSLRDATDVGRL